jgi:glycosyltransferase involved in cell wall biosynthesis
VANSLVSALADFPGIEITATAWSSITSSYDFHRIASGGCSFECVQPHLNLLHKAYANSWENQLANGKQLSRAFVMLGQVMNLARNPIKGVDAGKYDVVHSTYARFPRAVRKHFPHRVITVHDLTPLKLDASLFGPGQRQVTRRILDSIRPDDYVVCVSESTRCDFLDYSGHSRERCSVIPNGVDLDLFKPVECPDSLLELRKRYDLGGDPFFLTLSSMAPHKNLEFLLRSWLRFHDAHPGATLVVAGGADRQGVELLQRLTHGGGAVPRVKFIGFVDDEDFVRLASCCNAFLFPSLYEGFGLPVLEAMACGAPVICSNTSSLPEVVGNAGTVLDPRHTDAWIDAMAHFLSDGPRTNPSLRHLEIARQFSWCNAAARYADLYRNLLRE